MFTICTKICEWSDLKYFWLNNIFVYLEMVGGKTTDQKCCQLQSLIFRVSRVAVKIKSQGLRIPKCPLCVHVFRSKARNKWVVLFGPDSVERVSQVWTDCGTSLFGHQLAPKCSKPPKCPPLNLAASPKRKTTSEFNLWGFSFKVVSSPHGWQVFNILLHRVFSSTALFSNKKLWVF